MIAKPKRATVSRSINVLILTIIGIAFLIPLFWMISTSLKPDEQIMIVPMKWVPRPVQWSNYVEAVKAFPFLRYLWNTVFLTVLRVVGTLASTAMVGYAFAKLRWRGRDTIFYITIATMFLPGQVLIVPVYIIFSKLHWIDTYLPLVVPTLCGGGAFGVFMMRQFLLSIPDELLESGRIDGSSELRLLWRIVIPMSIPVLFTLGLFTFLFSWNDFFGPLIYLMDSARWTLPLGLRAFQQQYKTDWNLLMAASTLTSLPLVIIYFLGQDYISRGFTMRAGIK